jgi:hypothetical protein
MAYSEGYPKQIDFGDRRASARPYIDEERPIDPLTDSMAHRLGLGTVVRLHLYGGSHADVSLTAVRDVSTWRDLAYRIEHGLVVEVLAPRRAVFGKGAVMWGEVLSDQPDEASPAQ